MLSSLLATSMLLLLLLHLLGIELQLLACKPRKNISERNGIEVHMQHLHIFQQPLLNSSQSFRGLVHVLPDQILKHKGFGKQLELFFFMWQRWTSITLYPLNYNYGSES